MTMMTEPIIPPPELVQQWINEEDGLTAGHIATQSAQWGADHELEACCEYMQHEDFHGFATELRAARRPKLPRLKDDRRETHALATEARAVLAQTEPVAPTDEELLELMPETMRDEFSYAAKVCSDATGGQVKPGIFRVCLNHTALEYARAVLAKWGPQ